MATITTSHFVRHYDLTEKLFRLKSGLLTKAERVELFQRLINTGFCWQIGGEVALEASRLLFTGECKPNA